MPIDSSTKLEVDMILRHIYSGTFFVIYRDKTLSPFDGMEHYVLENLDSCELGWYSTDKLQREFKLATPAEHVLYGPF